MGLGLRLGLARGVGWVPGPRFDRPPFPPLPSWKYAQPETGALFTGPDDIVAAYDSIKARARDAALAPRAWFKSHSGQANAAVALEAFLQVTQGRARLDAAAAVGKRVT